MASIWRQWVALLDRREGPESLAVMRMIAGATAGITLVHAWYSGVAAALWVSSPAGIGALDPGMLAIWGGLTWPNVRALLAVGIAASTLLAFGLWTRLAAFAAWLSFRTLAFSNPLSGGSGDDVLSCALLLLLLSQSGRAWSVDALRKPRSPLVPAWPRYVAIGQLVTIYASAAWHKTTAPWMPHGSLDAIWYILQNPLWRRWPIALGEAGGRLTQWATLATWLFEASSLLLLLAFYYRQTADRPGRIRHLFNRWDVRTKYLLAGVLLHLGIEVTLEVGAFFGAMMAFYAACFHPTEWRAFANSIVLAIRRGETQSRGAEKALTESATPRAKPCPPRQ